MKQPLKNYLQGNVSNKNITSNEVDATFGMEKWKLGQGPNIDPKLQGLCPADSLINFQPVRVGSST